MKLLVAIPTRSRAHLLCQCAQFHKELIAYGAELKFFVEPHQRSDYRHFLREEHIHVLPEDNRGLMYACEQIYQYSMGRYDVLFKLDDDVRGFAARGKKSYFKRNLTRTVLDDCLTPFATHTYLGAVSFSYSHQLFSLKRWPSMNSRLQTSYLIRPEFFLSDLPRELDVWEDFTHTVMLRNMGAYSLRYGLAGIVCEEIGKLEGGLQDFNRIALYEQARVQLKHLVPDIEWRIVNKPWRLEPDFARTPSLRGFTLDADTVPNEDHLLFRIQHRKDVHAAQTS